MIQFDHLWNILAQYYFGGSELSTFGLLGLRIIWGFVMLLHSLPMARKPFAWMNKPPYPPTPAVLQACAAFTMFFGSFAVISGLFFPLAAIGLAGIMGMALSTHLRGGNPLLRATPDAPVDNYEGSLVYLFVAICFATTGPGYFSLDAWILNFILR